MLLHLKYALIVIAALVVVVLLSKWTGTRTGAAPSQVQRVVRQAADHNTAAHNQDDPVAALVDVTSALACLHTAVELSGPECVEKASGVSTRTLENEMVSHQRSLMRQMGEPVGVQPLPSI
jgi:dihydroxyacetone kinase DhaKLM complex PTS-EIIA-like component DhaM